MEWKDVGNVLAKVAPTLAATLCGPLAGTAVAALQEAFGLKAEGSTTEQQNAIVEALSGATAADMLKVKEADQRHAEAMAKLGYDNIEKLEAIASGDRDSARKREIEVKDKTPRNLAYAITAGYFGMLVFMMLAPIPNASRDILNYMLGTLGTAWIASVTYYFGSTSGSSEKSRLLAQASSAPEKKV